MRVTHVPWMPETTCMLEEHPQSRPTNHGTVGHQSGTDLRTQLSQGPQFANKECEAE